MLKDQLKERAKKIVQLPDRFQPVIEEYFEEENGEGEAMFSWADDQQEEEMSVTLDLDGNLTNLSIDLPGSATHRDALDERELNERAERFLLSHYPHALEVLTYYQTKKLMGAYRFYYEQIVMDLPLAHAGCFIDVESGGEIVNFKYYGSKPEPIIPEKLIAKEKLVEDVENRLDFRLVITNMDSSIHDAEENGLRLVYEIEPFFMNYKADILEPTLSIFHEEDEEDRELYVSLPSFHTEIRKDLSNEEIIGITAEMEVIREADWGEETGIVWRDRNWEAAENDLSINSFFQNHNEDTVKAFISKKTGKVKGFVWFKERSGELCLNRDECYQKALDFLYMMIPDCDQLLQLTVHGDDEADDTSTKEAFVFHMHNGHGIPVYSETVMVTVNQQTGEIDYYSGPGFDLEELKRIPAEPAISKKEAQDIFLSQLDFQLAWKENVEEQESSYILVYEACRQSSRKPIWYIDAMTGAVITDK